MSYSLDSLLMTLIPYFIIMDNSKNYNSTNMETYNHRKQFKKLRYKNTKRKMTRNYRNFKLNNQARC